MPHSDVGPPPRDGGSVGPTTDAPLSEFVDSHPGTKNTDSITASGRQAVYDVLARLRQRREHVVRSEGGDPEHPHDRRFHRPVTGLRAAGFRDGFARGGTDALRRVWPYIAAEHRAEVTRLATDYDVDREVAS